MYGELWRFVSQRIRVVPHVCAIRMDGSTSSGERGDLISQFNDETSATARVFLISSRSGGIGINLVRIMQSGCRFVRLDSHFPPKPAANRVVLFDSDFNPSIATQCVFRGKLPSRLRQPTTTPLVLTFEYL